EAARRPLAGRTRPEVRDVEGLREPVLAGRVPDRQTRPYPQRALRRGRVRPHGTPDPAATRRARPRAGGPRRYDADGADHARALPRLRPPAWGLRRLATGAGSGK